jgi:hypothetical protein
VDIVKLFLAKGARLDIYPKDGYESVLVQANYNLNVLRYLLIEKSVPIPAYAVIREEGTPNEKKLTLSQLLEERSDAILPRERAVFGEIMRYLSAHENK